MAMLRVLGSASAAAALVAIPTVQNIRSSHVRRYSLGERRHSSPCSSHFGPSSSVSTSFNSSLLGCVAAQAMAINGTVTQDEKPSVKVNSDQNLPDVMTEFMVDMKCEGCVSAVRKKLEPLDGVKSVVVDLPNQVVRIQGTAPLKALNEALEQTGRKSRLIGQGALNYIPNAATVAEFKGPEIFGVVRIVQVSMENTRIEANFSGLTEGAHGWSINEYGDLTRGAASTGKIYNPNKSTEPVGDLGVLFANSDGVAEYSGTKPMITVADLPGRALVVYRSEDKNEPGIAAAVIARSAGVGENYKKICTCDGTIIWESTNNDFVKV